MMENHLFHNYIHVEKKHIHISESIIWPWKRFMYRLNSNLDFLRPHDKRFILKPLSSVYIRVRLNLMSADEM